MKIYNHKIYSHLNGSNFASAKLTTTYHALTKGRLSSFMKVVIVLFAFIQPLIFSSCSTDNEEEDNKPTINYKAELTAHEWEITQAANRLGDFAIDIKDADAYCRFSSDSVYFSTVEKKPTILMPTTTSRKSMKYPLMVATPTPSGLKK